MILKINVNLQTLDTHAKTFNAKTLHAMKHTVQVLKKPCSRHSLVVNIIFT